MEQIWWERVPNALAFVRDITERLLEEKSVVLQYEDALPWRQYFIDLVLDAVRQGNAAKRVETIVDVDDPGAYLLQTSCKQTKRAAYRPAKGYARFFAESDDIVFHERYFWVTVVSERQLDAWTAFVSDYCKERGRDKAHAVFLLEWQGDSHIPRRKGVYLYSFDKYIGEYDRMIFAMLASSSVRETTRIKSYLAELSANIVGNDIELCAACLGRHMDFLRDPYTTIGTIVGQSLRSDGSPYSFDKSEAELRRCIWRAQIKTVYPEIEAFREDFVQRHRSAIAKQLPIETTYDVVEEPNDAELGTLIHLAGLGRLPLTTESYEELAAFRSARNKLSHLDVLTLDEIYRLLH